MIEAGHSLIAVGYFTLAAVSVVVGATIGRWRNHLELPAGGLGSRVFSRLERAGIAVGGALFFAGCGLTHVELLVHVAGGTVIDSGDWHHQIPVLMQVVGAPMFLLAIWPHIHTEKR